MEGFKDFLRHSELGYSDNEVISLYLHNVDKSITEISSVIGKSIGEIYRILHSNGVKPNRLKTNHHNVLEFAQAGMTIQKIAEFTGYTPRNVRYILSKLMRQNG